MNVKYRENITRINDKKIEMNSNVFLVYIDIKHCRFSSLKQRILGKKHIKKTDIPTENKIKVDTCCIKTV